MMTLAHHLKLNISWTVIALTKNLHFKFYVVLSKATVNTFNTVEPVTYKIPVL